MTPSFPPRRSSDRAGDLLVKSKAFAARERLQLDHHLAERPMPARLLLVPPPLGYGLSSRFAIGDTGLAAIHRNAIALLQPVEGDGQMLVIDALQQRLMKHLVLPPAQRRVFLRQLVERHRQADIVLAVAGH